MADSKSPIELKRIFNAAYITFSLIAIAAIFAFMKMAFAGPNTIIKEKIAPTPVITSRNTLEQVLSRFGEYQMIDSTAKEGLTCYQWSDTKTWLAQVCKPS